MDDSKLGELAGGIKMKTALRLVLSFLVMAILLTGAGCEKWVNNIDPIIGQVEDEALNDESQIPILINGVKGQFASTIDLVFLAADLLSDELGYDARLPGATYSTYPQIDEGIIVLDNYTVNAAYVNLGELRFYADDLVRRAGEISFAKEDAKNEALLWGNFFGGVARYFYAAYFGLNPNEGGGVIDGGPFIPSAEMYNLALQKFEAALPYANAYMKRVIHSLMARIYLFTEDYMNARTHAEQGLQEGDPPFQSLHNLESPNEYWRNAGHGRTQLYVSTWLLDYVKEDPAEAARIPVFPQTTKDKADTFYIQEKYATESDPIPLITWQENSLILAELDLRDGNSASALAYVNAVRASHGLAALSDLDMNGLIAERNKELFVTGIRLIDQRRFNQWHLDENAWHFLPIPESERNANPNLTGK